MLIWTWYILDLGILQVAWLLFLEKLESRDIVINNNQNNFKRCTYGLFERKYIFFKIIKSCRKSHIYIEIQKNINDKILLPSLSYAFCSCEGSTSFSFQMIRHTLCKCKCSCWEGGYFLRAFSCCFCLEKFCHKWGICAFYSHLPQFHPGTEKTRRKDLKYDEILDDV